MQKQLSHNIFSITKQQTFKPSCMDCGSIITTITDTGIGIDKQIVNRLFKIFGTVNRG